MGGIEEAQKAEEKGKKNANVEQGRQRKKIDF